MSASCPAVIIFDCDGVIFDTNRLKSGAFATVLSDFPQQEVSSFVEYFERSHQTTRQGLFRTFFTDFLKSEIDQDKLDKLLVCYGNLCQRLYEQAELTPGCLEILRELHGNVPLFIVSGSDELELREAFEKRGIAGYFENVYGGPRSKEENLEKILSQTDSVIDVYMIGDSLTDLRAAQKFRLNFVYMAAFSTNRREMDAEVKKLNYPLIETLLELPDLLKADA